jgi:hypothetical protein
MTLSPDASPGYYAQLQPVTNVAAFRDLTNTKKTKHSNSTPPNKPEMPPKLLRSRAAAARVKTQGRDHEEIARVLESMDEKQAFAPLMQYSLSCLATICSSKENIDSFVSLGGVDMCMRALQTHSTKPRILEEISKIFIAISENAEYAEQLGEEGVLEVVVGCIETNEAEMGVFGVDTLLATMHAPSNIARFNTAEQGLEVCVAILHSEVDELPTKAITLIETVAVDDASMGKLVGANMHTELLGACEAQTGNIGFLRPGVRMLSRCAGFQQGFCIAEMRTACAVNTVCTVMCDFPDDFELMDAGKQFLVMVSNTDDLTDALNVLKHGDMGDGQYVVRTLFFGLFFLVVFRVVALRL